MEKAHTSENSNAGKMDMNPNTNRAGICYFPPSRKDGEMNNSKRVQTLKINVDSAQLQSFTSEQADTLPALLCAAWGLVLKCYTGLDTVCFGFLETRRNVSINQPCADMTMVRMNFDNIASLSELVRRVQEDHRSSPDADIAYTPSPFHFNTSIVLRDDVRAGNIAPSNNNRTRSDQNQELSICIHVKIRNGNISVFLEWWSSFMSKEHAMTVGNTFSHCLKSIVAFPETAVSGLSYFSEKDKEQVLLWNKTIPDRVDSCVHDVICNQVQTQPAAEAVCSWDGSFTYEELYEASSRIATQLGKLGIQPEDMVCLAFEKSKWAIAAIFGVMLAGGAFVSLDPSHPIDRLQALSRQVNAKAILCSRQHQENLRPIANTVIAVDENTVRSTQPLTAPTRVSSNNAVYVIFTSGSTGTPKATVIEHGAFCSNAPYMARLMHINSSSRIFQFSAFTFDASVLDILVGLMTGACICIPSESERLNDIAGSVTRTRANWAIFTPSFVETLEPSAISNIKTLVLGGEAVSKNNLRWTKYFNVCNGYGPTETSIAAAANPGLSENSDPTCIGRPTAGIFWVVDPDNHDILLPVGAVGELVLEGPFLARGYLNDAAKTNAVFIENPLWASDMCPENMKAFERRRMYKTGDLVRYNPDGTLRFVGRKDYQVKVNAQRVELGEIEHHLTIDADVRQGLVVYPKSGPCAKRLVSVITVPHFSGSDAGFTPVSEKDSVLALSVSQGIRERLGSRLPPYMVPAIWVVVYDIPRQASGKLDRKTVTSWVEQMSAETYKDITGVHRTDNRPVTHFEERLCRAIAETLGLDIDTVATNQSFLVLGGESLTAIRLMKMCKHLGIDLTVQEILRSKSISDLAALAANRSSATGTSLDPDFELSPFQHFYLKGSNEQQRKLNPSITVDVDIPGGSIRKEDLTSAVSNLVQKYSILRTRLFLDENTAEWRGRVVDDISGSFKIGPLDSLDAVNGPVLAADLFNTKAGYQKISVTALGAITSQAFIKRALLPELARLLTTSSSQSEADSSILNVNLARGTGIGSYGKPVSCSIIEDFSYWGGKSASDAVTYDAFELDDDVTAVIVSKSQNAYRCTAQDIVLSSVAYSFAQIFNNRNTPTIHIENEDLRNVGFSTALAAVTVPISLEDDLLGTIRRVKDASRKASECGYGHLPAELVFRYLADTQAVYGCLQMDVESIENQFVHRGLGLFEISVGFVGGRMRVSFTFDQNLNHQDAIRDWVTSCKRILIVAAETLAQIKEPEFTLSDLQLLSLSEEDFENLVNEILPTLKLSPSDVEDIFPCSPMQEGILVSQARNPHHYAVHLMCEAKVRSGSSLDLDTEKLLSAWRSVVAKHPPLRTIFIDTLTGKGGLFNQIVLRSPQIDTHTLLAKGKEEALFLMGKQDPVIYDDKSRLPHKLTICKTTDGRLFMKIEMSHAITDGESMSILLRDLSFAYGAEISHERGPSFSDYIGFLHRADFAVSYDYWKEYLAEVEPCHFPVLNDGQSKVRELGSLRINFPRLRELQKFCDSNGLTLANAFHAAWALTLNCYVGVEDVCFGYLTAGRDVVNRGNDAIGPYINMATCRAKLTDNITLKDLLLSLQDEYVESLPHRHISLAEIQHLLQLSGEVLFNTALSFRKVSSTPKSARNALILEECAPAYDPTEFSVSIGVEATEDDAEIFLDYWTDHLSHGQAANVSSTFVAALENVLFHSEQKIQNLDHFSKTHFEQVSRWNPEIPTYINRCMHEVVEEQVLLRPDAPALCGWDGSFTYRELDSISNRLANHLVELGVAPETLVPVCFDKSVYTVISMLAILKAGGACVPLDAKTPRVNLEGRVMDSGSSIVVASVERAEIFDDMVPNVVAVDSAFCQELPYSEESPHAPVLPTNAAFVIFTSGSTGKPKGVVLEHRALVTSAEAHGSKIKIGPHSRFLQFASYTFDNSIEEMFTTLERGGCVCVPSEDERRDDLAGAIKRYNANFMDLTPTVASMLMPSDVPSIKGMVLGGEALTKKLIEVWNKEVNLYCMYGPSEASINSTFNGDLGNSEEATNIGKAIGTVSWIVHPEDHNKLVPLGSAGELLLEGPILARGYLNDDVKTRNAFIENPTWTSRFAHLHGKTRRMYKTGDLVRYNSDGTITYLGRKDSQIKLNGQRIELGEIEHHVKTNLPTELQSGVELVNMDGHKALAAFITFHGDTADDSIILPMSDAFRAVAKRLEDRLKALLPPYMVPSAFIPVKRLPMTSSGKLDRRTLRTLIQSLHEQQCKTYRLASGNGRAPRTAMEKKLAALWEQTLGLPDNTVGADDSFFRLGGDSILSMKLVSAARTQGITLSVASIFVKPRLFEMAAGATEQTTAEAVIEADAVSFEMAPDEGSLSMLMAEVASLCKVEASAVEDILPSTPLQAGLIALSNKQAGTYVAQQVYRLPLGIDIHRFKRAWQSVVDSEAVLRTRIVQVNSKSLQVVIREKINWKADSTLEEIAQQRLGPLPAYNGGPLTSYHIIGEGMEDTFFAWRIHHALYDGWSLPLILQRVEEAYRVDQSLLSIPSGVSFRRFIKHISTIDSVASDQFWMTKLSDITARQFPQLPYPAYQIGSVKQKQYTVDIRKVTEVEVTLPTLIRAAWALLTSAYTGASDVVFGETLSGRDAPEGIENMIGPTLATVPMRIQIDGNYTVSEFLANVQVQSSEVITYQHAGLQHIKRLSRDTAAACEFQNLLSINRVTEEEGSSLFDLQGDIASHGDFYTYPLVIDCKLEGARVDLDVHYDADLLPDWQVERLLKQLDEVLHRLNSTEFASVRINEVPLVSAWDVQSIHGWNSFAVETVENCIHEKIDEQVLMKPEAEAVRAWDATFTYRELDLHSTRLAYHLAQLGVKEEVIVPLCFEKSAWVVVAMLAVLKAGGAFVPLDPAHPPARLKDIVLGVDAKIALCSSKYHRLASTLTPKAIAVNGFTFIGVESAVENLPKVSPNSAAYVIFTSGTTGKPKGTLIEHASYCTGAAAHAPAMGMEPGGVRSLQFASFTFDASLLEIVTTLMIGGCVCIPSDEDRLDAFKLSQFMTDTNVNWSLLTPSFARMLAPSSVPTLKTLVLGGEAMAKDHIDAWADTVKLCNAYGPSETSVVALVNSTVTRTTSPTHVGKATGGYAWVVDPKNHNRLSPVGCIGELCISGAIVSRGYLNEPEKTAEAFVENPEWANGANLGRLYKTGDLVRYDADGSLLFIGRKESSQQIKINGQRMEINEVEHHIAEDQNVQHALVVFPTVGHCKSRLTAVISPKSSLSMSAEGDFQLVDPKTGSFYIKGVRERLCERLPAYMIPARWIVLTHLPLSSSGKLNRRAVLNWVENMSSDLFLLVSELDKAEEDVAVNANPTECRLQNIWSEVLGLPVEQVGLHQSFLHLGGDSILAMTVVSKCRNHDIGITVQDILQSKSIRDLAGRATLPSKMLFAEEKLEKDFDLSPIQKLFFQCAAGASTHFNQSIVVQCTKPVDHQNLELGIKSLVETHSMLRARFRRDVAGIWKQRIVKDSASSYKLRVHDLPSASEDTLRKFIKESQECINIEEGPILAAELFNIKDNGKQLISLAIHHLAVDIVSWRIILQDLEEYLTTGQAVRSSELSFQTWLKLQELNAQDLVASEVFPFEGVPQADFKYWGVEDNTHGASLMEEFELDSQTTLKLLGVANAALNTEAQDLFISAILHSFRQVFPDRLTPPAVYNEGHGREPWESSIDLSRTVGWFTTLCPIFTPTSTNEEQDLINTIRWVKDFRKRVPDKGRPYFAYRLLTEDGERRFSQHWPAEVTFNYLGHQNNEKNTGILQPFTESDLNSASDIGMEMPRFGLFEISASITHGKLKFGFIYNSEMKRKALVKKWVSACSETLEVIATELSNRKSEPTLSDFPLLPLSYDGLPKLIDRLPNCRISSLNEIEDVYPVSPMQQGLLISQIRNSSHYAFKLVFEAFTVDKKPVNVETLAEAWERVVEKHSTLRTVFIDSICREGAFDQVVIRKITPNVSWLYCKETEIDSVFRNQEPADLCGSTPPHRFTICETHSGRVFCKLEMSHAIMDGTSMPILLKDLSKAYEGVSAFAHERPLYSDFIAYLQKSSHDADVDYWKGYLKDVEPCLFPTLNDGGNTEKNGQLENLELHMSTIELQSFCIRHGKTLANVLQLVWALVLRTYTGSEEVSFGYLVSGREAPVRNITDVVGPLINILVCRISLTDDVRINQALEQIQSDYVQGISHQSCSLAEVQHEMDLAGASLFDTAFSFQKRPAEKSKEKDALQYNVLEAHDPSEYTITVNAEVVDSNMTVHFGYWRDKILPSQAASIANTFEAILLSIITEQENPKKIRELNLVGDHCLSRIRDWNSSLPTTVKECVHDLIYKQTEGRENEPAVTAWDANFTYGDLHRLSGRLAKHLVENLHVGPEMFVPILFEKSAWTVVSIVAILKAGAAYVPLDPAHPSSRLQALINDIGAKVVLCSQEHTELASGVAETAITVNEKLVEGLSDIQGSHRLTTVGPGNAAYIIFTSGTTGKPKGTIVEHSAFATGALAHGKAMFMDRCSRVLQFASLTFDASTMEILSCLLFGGCVCVPSAQERLSDITRAINKMNVNWTLLTPSVANTIEPASVPGLKVLVLGGEAMAKGDVAKWSEHVTLINAYGPSECSVISTIGVKTKNGARLNEDPATIGHAVGSRCWIVDPRNFNRLVPVGAVGELVVEGGIVARGYANEPEKTKAVFVRNPDWKNLTGLEHPVEPEQKMYRTGDLVRYNSDGSFSFLGRRDSQVKLNGQRIEVGEIEYHVKVNLPEGSQAAVDLVHPSDRNGSKALACFFSIPITKRPTDVFTQKDASVDSLNTTVADEEYDLIVPLSDNLRLVAKNLENALIGALPGYMVPTLFIPVSKLPWTTSGKLDRTSLRNAVKALSHEDTTIYRLAETTEKAVPTTEREKTLQRLWENILQLKPGTVGAEDNFFRLGGDSVGSMRLVAAARTEGVGLTVIDIFRNPKLSDMAEVSTTLTEDVNQELRPFSLLRGIDSIDHLLEDLSNQIGIEKETIEDAYSCTALQEGLITMSIKQPGAYVARNVFRIPSAVDLSKFKAAWQKVVRDEPILRTRVVNTSSSGFLQVVVREEPISWSTRSSLDDLTDEDNYLPAYNGAPLISYVIIEEEKTDIRWFVWSIHHALYDGWSLPLVLERVEAAYFEDKSIEPIEPAPYSRLIKYLFDHNGAPADNFWRSRLAGASPMQFPQLPHTQEDRPRDARQHVHSLHLSRDTSGMDITMSTTIRAAWAVVLSAYTASEDVVFGETLTGRDIPVPGITDMIGPTLTTVPTRIIVDRNSTIASFLRMVHDQAAEAIPYQHAGLQRIKRLNSDTSSACDFQNLIVIQPAPAPIKDSIWELQSSGGGSNFFTYPLVLECRINDLDIDVIAYSDENVISTWEVQRILFQFEAVLKQLAKSLDNTSARLTDIEVLSAQDKEMITSWNGKPLEIVDECIHHTFEKQVRRQPKNPAVTGWDGEMTYEQLNEYSALLAQYLVHLGVGPESYVPICCEKSIWSIVAIMGVLKAGGAFVPMDANHPTSRHQEIVNDVVAGVILCSPQYVERMSGIVDTAVPIDAKMVDRLKGARLPSFDLSAIPIRPSNAAYVIFTSGSTGKPKGVIIEHGAFSTSSAAFCRGMLMKPTSRVLQFASLIFDASVMEILGALTIGACLCVPSDEERMSDISTAIQRMKVTWTLLTPSVASIIEPSQVPCLETLVCGGEAMSIENITKWGGKLEGLVNAYGPSECSVVATVNSDVWGKKDPSNIGQTPGAGYAWIVDPEDIDRLSPVGCVGELLIEGPTLARGYLKDEVKTAAAFIEDPTWARQDGRMRRRFYRTGDLVKYAPDGTIKYIGRADGQVKVNGQRLELGEIEHRLGLNDRVRHSLVVMPKAGPCKKRLVCVLSLNDLVPQISSLSSNTIELVEEGPRLKSARLQVVQVKERLSEQLPSYMVPSFWVIVEAVPLLPSGKLDRKQVSRWVENFDKKLYGRIKGGEEESDSQAPATHTAKVLQRIWSKVLNLPIEDVKLNESFLSLGGDSITAMQVLSRARKEKINVTMHEILRSKSLNQLSLVAGTIESSTVQEEKLDTPFELSPIQQLYMQTMSDPTNNTGDNRFNQSFTLKISRRVREQDLHRAIETIVSQHSMLRARFEKKTDGSWRQKITKDVSTSYRFRMFHSDKPEKIIPAIANSQVSLDIQNGPVLAVDLFDIDGEGQVLFMVAHHLVIDLVSWRVLLGDLEELLSSGELMDKPLSFQTWCSMQIDHARENAAKNAGSILPFRVTPANLNYWGMKNKPNTYADVETASFTVDPAISALALGESHTALRTEPIELFLASIVHSFGRVFKDRQTPSIFNEGHGREPWDRSTDLSRTVGWFTTISPLHAAVSKEEEDAVETLVRMKDIRRKISGNGRPYFAHRFLTPEGRMQFRDHMPAEIVFNYLGLMQQLEKSDSLLQQYDYSSIHSDDIHLTSDVGKNVTRFALFELSTAVVHGQVQFTFMYNKNMKHQERIQEWVKECQKTFEITVKRLADIKFKPTLSDYPLLPLSYASLKKMEKTVLPRVGVAKMDVIEDIYPSSPMQEGLLLSQLRDTDVYSFIFTTECVPTREGVVVDTQKLLRSWQMVVDRHTALRTVFIDSACRDGKFDQVVLKKEFVNIGSILIKCDDSELQEKLNEDYSSTRTKPRLPHQLVICETTSGKVWVKLDMNHVIIDGTSVSCMYHDLARAYDGVLPEGPALPYRDYIAYMNSHPPGADIKFWRGLLEGLKPSHFPKLTEGKAEKRLGSVNVDFDYFDELQDLCEKMGITLSNLMQTAWGLVLRQYTGMDDVCFGYLTAGRDAPLQGIQEAVGAFINMLVCRINFTQNASLETVFKRVQNNFLESLPFQHCSLAQVHHELGLSGQTLFNTALSIQNNTRAADIADTSITFETRSWHDPSEYKLSLNIETGRGAEGVLITYWNDYVDDSAAAKVAETYAKVLQAILDNPQRVATEWDKPVDIPQPVATKIEEPASPAVQAQVVSQAASGTVVPMMPSMNIDFESMMRRIVQETVSEVIGRLMESGQIMGSSQGQAAMLATKHSMQVIGQESQNPAQSVPELTEKQKKKQAITQRLMAMQQLAVHHSKPEDGRTKDQLAIYGTEQGGLKLDDETLARLEEEKLQKLVTLWSELLNVPENQLHSDRSFFALGGDSIIAMKMVGSAKLMGISMTVADVFRFPKLGDLAKIVRLIDNRGTDVTAAAVAAEAEIAGVTQESQVVYEPFSLLTVDDIDKFIQRVVCPKVGVFRGGIVDVFPVTDFQALAITGSLLRSRWMLNYYCMDGAGTLNITTLKRNIGYVIQNIDILRTVFIQHNGQFLQVVLRKLQPEFHIHDIDEEFNTFMDGIQQRDRDETPRLGESYLRFFVLRRKKTSRHRIIMRISHAQYDGVCLPAIMTALQAAYNGSIIPPSPPFANYVRSTTGAVTKYHHDYWRELLKGSRMTEIVARDTANYPITTGTARVLRQTVIVSSLGAEGITHATIIKAAWSLVLARLSACPDVVYGHVISGRNVAVQDIDKIIGLCLNTVPIRVPFKAGWTVMDLLRYTQDQQVSGMPFESLGFREIIRKCTDWPEWTNFTTTLQHQNIDQNTKLQLGDIVYELSARGSEEEFADISIVSFPKSANKIEICLTFAPNGPIKEPFAEKVLKMLCSTMAEFSEDTSKVLPTPDEISSLRKHSVFDTTPVRVEGLAAGLRGLPETHKLRLSEAIKGAWRQVLSIESEARVPLHQHSSIFDLGGDLISVAQVATILHHEGFDIDVEELANHPVLGDQVALLALKNRPELATPSSMSSTDTIAVTPAAEPVTPTAPVRRSTFFRLASSLTFRKKKQAVDNEGNSPARAEGNSVVVAA